MKKFRWNIVVMAVVLALVAAACAPAATPTPEPMPTAAPTSAPVVEPTSAPAAAAQNIIDVAVADGRFTTLATALTAAGLVETLQGDGPFTVFAPTDEAFAALPEGVLEGLLADTEALTAVLLYHVVAGEVPASAVVNLSSADTVQGEAVSIRTDMGNVYMNEAQVIVDILSRFLFEREVFEKRNAGDLSAEELCAIMTDAQKQTYGDGLDENFPHPYMWAVKSHYYRPDLAFYNFPYAFGLLLGLSFFASYKNEGPAFAKRYRDILLTTGKYSAVEVTARAGFTIEDGAFWRRGMDTVRGHIETFLNLAHI